MWEKVAQQWFRDSNIDFIQANQWPPSSPDLNPLDFCVWGVLEERVCRHPHASIESLKESLVAEWNKIPQKIFYKACLSVERRLRECILAEGGLIE